ncbi:MAG: hypothetical protein PUE84_02040 [Firmicutes bacterium]|nr:hypothetical protein [Bacillota bacterium]
MQGNTEKKKGAVIAAVVMIAIVLVFVGALVVLLLGEEDLFADGIAWMYITGGVAVVIGVLVALRQRFAEIHRGEEEEAKKY